MMINSKKPITVNAQTMREKGMHSLAWECVILARWNFTLETPPLRPRNWLVKIKFPEAWGYTGIATIPGQYRRETCETLCVVLLDGTSKAATFLCRTFTSEIRRRRRAEFRRYEKDVRAICDRIRRGEGVHYEPGDKGGRLWFDDFGPVSAKGVCQRLCIPETYLPDEADNFLL